MIWLVLLLGLVALAGCYLLPREIGKEDDPLPSVRVELPDFTRVASRLHRPAARAQPRPANPPAMGATQPVLTEDPASELALPDFQ
ncbi:MAG TPA: hypothetical protein VF157_05825 [Chloroflexota bacterium]